MDMYYKNIDAKFLAADELIEYGDVRQAKDILDEILMDDPTYGRAHDHLGWIYANKLTDYKKAERHLKLAFQYTPEFPGTYTNFAQLLMLTNRFDELFQHAESSNSIPGVDKSSITRYMALAHEKMGEKKQAVRLFREARDMELEDEVVDLLNNDLSRLRKKMNWWSWKFA